MAEPETLMKQAGLTTETWLNQAEEAVKHMNISEDSKVIIIAAFIRTAAQDQHTMTIRFLAEAGLLTSTSD